MKTFCFLVVAAELVINTQSWVFPSSRTSVSPSQATARYSTINGGDDADNTVAITRRQTLVSAVMGVATTSSLLGWSAAANAATEESIFAPKFIQQYEDFISLPNGVSYRDVTVGKGTPAARGDRVVFDWSGYTIGYFGRPFQAKGGPQGGAFDKDIDYERTVLGSSKLVPGLEAALEGMQVGGIRQIVIPYETGLSYPPDDLSHDRVGPKPFTFSGQRALNFVLENPRLDRTLLFNVKVIRIDKPNNSGGFIRG